MRKVYLLDKNRSCLFSGEIKRFKEEITKQKNNPICTQLSTIEVANIGADDMKSDNFCMAKEKIDV